MPILGYGCEVWFDGRVMDVVERTQLKHLKYMLGQNPSLGILRYIVFEAASTNCEILASYTLQSPNDNMFRHACNSLREQCNAGQNN